MSCACQTLVSKPGAAIKNVSPKRTRRKNLMNEIERRDIQQLKNMGFESCDPRFQEHLFVRRHKTPRRIDSTSRAALHTKSNHTFLAPVASLTTGGPALSPFRSAHFPFNPFSSPPPSSLQSLQSADASQRTHSRIH